MTSWLGTLGGAAALAPLLAACAEQTAPPPADLAGACAAAVAAHVGRPVAELTARPGGTAPDGLTVIEVTDTGQGADRTHACEVDGGARVHALRHPSA